MADKNIIKNKKRKNKRKRNKHKKFNKELIEFMCYLNILHIGTTILVFLKKNLLYSLPSLFLTITSYLYWTNPKDGIIMKIDETMAHFNVIFQLYNSFIFNRELPVILIVYCMIFLYAYSNYFLKIKNNEYSLFFHSIVVLLGNIAAIIVYY